VINQVLTTRFNPVIGLGIQSPRNKERNSLVIDEVFATQEKKEERTISQ